MIKDFEYTEQVLDILESGRINLSDISPSEWAEQNIIMPKPFPGPLKYSRTPYTREIIDCFAPDHPAKVIAFMKGAQFGGTATIIVPLIGWLIQHHPANIIMTVGHDSLIDEAMAKVDAMLDSTGLRKYIKPQAQRNRSQKSGDTNTKKEFAGGYIKISSASNHKIWRQADYQIGLIDDYEAIKRASKEAGSTEAMIMQRFASYADKMKIMFMSTPELDSLSNIKPAYLLGDQRKYLVPCPCCGEHIELRWSVQEDGKDMGGINWKTDNKGILIRETVGYMCQICAGFFTDAEKTKMLNEGFWKPTATPSKMGYYSYHCSALYAPHGMYDWEHYVGEWMKANPSGANIQEHRLKSFTNLCLAETYTPVGDSPKANQLQKNVRNYDIGTVPEKMSIADGNGKIITLTCTCDLNGTPEDARLDYEVLAHSESGSTYSIVAGSIGTFIPRENAMKVKADREKWTYELTKQNNVWDEFDKVIDTIYLTDTGRRMKVFISGVDTGHYNNFAYEYIDKSNFNIVALKGKDADKYTRLGVDMQSFKQGRERPNLYLVEVGHVKDRLSSYINLKWDETDEVQPANFMNFPVPSDRKYTFANYFSHYESEHRIVEENAGGDGITSRWQKKTSTSQNHFWDVRVYGIVIRDIMIFLLGREMKLKDFTWRDFVDMTRK